MNRKIAFIALAALCSCGGTDEKAAGPDAVSVTRRIQECSRIYTSEYQVSKIIVQNDEMRVQGKFLGLDIDFGVAGGQRVIALPVKGVVKAYVDMANVTPEAVNVHGDSVEVVLPDPEIELTATRISADEIRQKIGLIRSDFTDAELTRIQKAGRDSLLRDIPRLWLEKNARISAGRVLIGLLADMGFRPEAITITFSSDAPRRRPSTSRPELEIPAK